MSKLIKLVFVMETDEPQETQYDCLSMVVNCMTKAIDGADSMDDLAGVFDSMYMDDIVVMGPREEKTPIKYEDYFNG